MYDVTCNRDADSLTLSFCSTHRIDFTNTSIDYVYCPVSKLFLYLFMRWWFGISCCPRAKYRLSYFLVKGHSEVHNGTSLKDFKCGGVALRGVCCTVLSLLKYGVLYKHPCCVVMSLYFAT